MNIIPYERYTLRTDLSRDEIQNRIRGCIEYKGYATKDNFEIRRIIPYRNTLLPKISGKITDGYQERIIEVTVRLDTIGYGFLFLWFGGVFCFCLLWASPLLDFTNPEMGIYRFIPYSMLIIGTPVVIISYIYESRKSKKDLLRILDAQLVPRY